MGKNDVTELVERKYKNQSVSISNSVIRSREFTNLLESKIEVLAIYYMESDLKQKEKLDPNGQKYKVNYVELSASDIKKLMGRSDGATYGEIYKAANNLEEKLYIIKDEENHRFSMDHLYGKITYDRGMLSIEFNPDMNKYFLNLQEKYTMLRLTILFSFKRNGGFQLYKLLKSYMHSQNIEPIDMSLTQEELPSIRLSWNLTDLRMIMGYVDINQKELKKEGEKKHPDWEKMSKEEKNPQYKRWADFKKRVIDPGVEEINKISDIHICQVETERTGLGGKVSNVAFIVQHNKAYYEKSRGAYSAKGDKEEKIKLTEEQIDDFIDEMREFIDVKGVKTKDLKAIAEAAGYDMEKIKVQYDNSKGTDINNFTGWMISALKRGYKKPAGSKRTVDNGGFSNQRDYDFDKLEEELLKKSRGEEYDLSGVERRGKAEAV